MPPTTASITEQGRFDFFRLLAIGSCAFSVLSVIFLAISIPMLYNQMEQERSLIGDKSKLFRDNSNRIWSVLLHADSVDNGKSKRSVLRAGGVCEGCKQLTCPPGPVGPPGNPGEDSQPGQPGQSGVPGEEGFDIALSPEQDQPCIVCPAGPPGMRGYQGERGQTGQAGTPGEPGDAGQMGIDGAQGAAGPPGNAGAKRKPGFAGPPGNSIVAGTGVKGPKGPAGPAGAPGPSGMPGKSRMGQGQPGSQGQTGPEGPPGQSGKQGESGDAGTPGEPGQPSMYCQSDCGISHITVPGFSKQLVANAVEELATQEGTSTRAPYGRRARRKKANSEGFKPQIRRHPIGGYYWHS